MISTIDFYSGVSKFYWILDIGALRIIFVTKSGGPNGECHKPEETNLRLFLDSAKIYTPFDSVTKKIQWKRINCKQNARWQHVSWSTAGAFGTL
jgi:hypothetical protein